jgi:methyl-accepting chemotaxis protein
MGRMNVRHQVSLGFAACLVGLSLIATVASGALQSVAGTKDRVIDQRVPLVNQAHELDALFATKASIGRGFIISGNEELVTRLAEADRQFEALLAKMRDADGPELAAMLRNVAEADDSWDAAFTDLASRRRTTGSADAVARSVESALFPAYEQVRASLTDVVSAEQTAITRDVAASDRDKRAALIVLWLLVAVTLATTAGLAFWVTRRVTRQLTQLAVRVDGAAHEILAGVSQQVSGATEQAAAVQQTAATVDELVQTAEQAVERAQTVAGRAQESAQVADEGSRAVEDTNAGMLEIRDQVAEIAQRILELTERAKSIGDIVDTVEEIARETHLLALNAAIEAARAGEHGHGFAVVAAEVRNLADQSKAATADVTRILGQIEQGTGAAVMATEEGTKSTEAGTELIARAGTTIGQLAEIIRSATLAAEQIAASSRQQAAATVQISQAMRNVDTVMEQNVAAARQSEQTAQALTEAAQQMKQLVGAG